MSRWVEEREVTTSRTLRLAGRFLRRSWQALAVLVLALALGVAAFLSPGLVQADVQLDEGTVYPGKRENGLIGILNAQIDELAEAMPVGTTSFHILQHEDTVLIHGESASTLVAYNPGRNRPGSVLQLPTNGQVALGADTLAVTSPDNGRVWFGDVETVLRYDFQTEDAALEIDEFGLSTVTTGGNVISLNVQTSQLVRPGEDEDEVLTVDLPWQINPEAPNVQLSAVGERAVVLDVEAGQIWVEGMNDHFTVSGAATAQLATPSADALRGEGRARAVYATQAGLIAVTPDGPRSLSGQMEASPVRPVQVGDCLYAAFGDQFVKRCLDAEPEVHEIPDIPAGADLTFHVNRSTVILNDMESGVIWMVDKDMLRIDDWDGVNPPTQEVATEEPEVHTEIPPERDARNNPPVAEDDFLAARAGRSTILPVLDNDSDPDGDVLTISVGNTQLNGASLELVRGGAGLQITIDATTSGDLEFQYTISDGRPGGTDSANVTVRVLPADPNAENTAPRKHELAQPLTVQLGTTVTKRVLLDWRDDEGDPMMLVDASLPLDAEDEVSFTPDGEITYRDIGKTTGTKTIDVVVSDGYSTADGELIINVVDDTVAPMAFGDFATVRAGDLVTIEPLLNDVGVNMILTDVDPGEDCACLVETNNREDYFTFRSDVPDTYYVTYQVSNPLVAMGLVRIDVLPDAANALPVAALDIALLPPGGSVTIDPLLNDTSPRGDVLVVQSVSQAEGLEIVLERRHLVTIRALTRQTEPITLTYWVSDGRNSVPGTIIVMPTSTQGSVEPQAAGDTVRIRAGSTQSVNVLANDVSPVGLDLSLDDLVENPFDDRAWIDGDQLRISIPPGAGATTSTITYQIRDEEGRISSAQVTVQVVSEDDQNEAPVPRPVTDRVLAGTTTRIAIPLDGIDINGDAVRLLGIGSGPSLGRVMNTGDGWLLYEAFPSSQGTDVFRYQVVDALGAIGSEEIRIGVAPAGPTNNAPVGVLDEMTVRPGSPVQIPALRNDVDVDGDSISYAATDAVQIDGVEHVEVIEGREIAFTAPSQVGEYRGVYHIEDSRGEPGSGNILLRVSDTAPLLPPDPRDDLVPVSAVVGRDWVEVDVLANDFDPDGLHEDLRVRVLDETEEEDSPRTGDDGRGVVVPIADHMQQVRYEVVDADDLSATAVVTVPGRGDSVPVLNDPDVSFTVTAGQPRSLEINSLVSGTEGRSVRLTSVDNVTATHGVVAPGPERIEYTPSLEYSGPASVVFEVADVVREGDNTGKSTFISIPITVTPANLGEEGGDDPTAEVLPPPELIGEPPVVQVGPGEGESRRDLRPLIKVHTGGNFYFENFQHVEGDQRIEWRSDANGIIFAWTEIDVLPGTTRIVSAEAVDARGARVSFPIRLEVVSSRMPLPTAAGYDAEAIAGQEAAVPVLTESRSNLPDRAGLHLVGAPSVMPANAGTASYEGETVKFRPAEGFVGTMTVSYTIVDDTMDPARHMDGFIRVTVKDRPSRPGAPRDARVSSGTITFTYTPGSSNGFEVTRRVVIPVRSDGTELGPHECTSTTCTITDLPNGVPYQLKVIETNEAGDSDPSPLSAAYTPDQRPLPPGIRISDFDDRSLDVEWQEVEWEDEGNPGSPVERFTLFLLAENGDVVGERNMSPGQRAYTWTGLTNGTRYRFAINATNAAGTSDRSSPTDPEYPAAPPGPSPSVTHLPKEDVLGGGAFDVTWSTNLETNGDAVSKYIITPITQSGRGTAREVDPRGGSTQSVSMEGLGQVPYRFEVRAVNKAGTGEPAVTPEWKTAWEMPKVTNASVARGEPGSLVVSMETNFDDRPQAEPQRQYSLDGRGWESLRGDGVIPGLTNGRSYDVDVRVVIDGQKASSAQRAGGDSRPRSSTPAVPEKSAHHTLLRSGSRARISVQEFSNYLDTGGWAPDRYRFSCRSGHSNGCNSAGSNAFDVHAPSDSTITVTHQDHDSWSAHLDYGVSSPHGGSYDEESRALDVTVRYVRNAQCTVTVGGFRENYSQGSTYGTFRIQETLPEDQVSGSRAQVSCRAQHLDQSIDFSVN